MFLQASQYLFITKKKNISELKFEGFLIVSRETKNYKFYFLWNMY